MLGWIVVIGLVAAAAFYLGVLLGYARGRVAGYRKAWGLMTRL